MTIVYRIFLGLHAGGVILGIIIRMDFILALLLSFLSLFSNGEGVVVEGTNPSATSTMAEVVRVIDGDTIVVQIAGEEQTIRYIGIDTPEPYRYGEPACFSLEASLRNKELVQGKMVRLESDYEDTDRYNRLLRYVYVDNVFVNAELVKGGYAKTLVIKPNVAHRSQFADLEQVARESESGIWGVCQ